MMFDEFYRTIYNQLFFKWILCHDKQYQQDHIQYHVETENEKLKFSIAF